MFCRPITKQATNFKFIGISMETFPSPKAKMKHFRPDKTLNLQPVVYKKIVGTIWENSVQTVYIMWHTWGWEG